MTQFTVQTSSGQFTFNSDYTLEQAKKIISGLSSNFAQDLSKRDSLSDKQIAWVHKLAVDASKPADHAVVATVTAPAPVVVQWMHMPAILTRFNTAKEQGIKYPTMKLPIDAQGNRLVLRFCGAQSKTPGDVSIWYLKAGVKGYGNWLARVSHTDGGRVYGYSTRTAPEFRDVAIKTAMESMAENFDTYVAGLGVLYGRCQYCSTLLTDPVSMARGYGDICKTHWGLPD